MESQITQGLRQIRLGNTVLQKKQVRKQLIAEVNELLSRLEQLEDQASFHQSHARQSWQQMINQRCSTLALLCAN